MPWKRYIYEVYGVVDPEYIDPTAPFTRYNGMVQSLANCSTAKCAKSWLRTYKKNLKKEGRKKYLTFGISPIEWDKTFVVGRQKNVTKEWVKV